MLLYEKSLILYLKTEQIGVYHMEAAVKILYLPEEQARQKIRNYVNEGLKDVQENAIIDIGDYILYK